MTEDRPDGPRQPDYGDGGRPAEALVADDASDENRPAAKAASDDPDRYRAPEEGGEGPPAEETPQGESLTPLAPADGDQDPPFTDPFGPSG
jgi:hypothetical protein